MNLQINPWLAITHVPTVEEGVPKGKEDSSGFQLQSSNENRERVQTMCADDTANVQVKVEQSSDPERSDESDSLVIIPDNDVDDEPDLVCSNEVVDSDSTNVVKEKKNPGSSYIPCELSLKDASGRYRQVSFKDILDFFRLPRDQETSFGGDSDIFSNLFTAKRQFEQSYPAAGIVGRFGQTGSGKISDDIKFLRKLKNPNKHYVEVWLKLRNFINQIFGDSVNTGWGSGFQELDNLVPENNSKDPNAEDPNADSVSIPSNSPEFLDATIDFLIELLKDRQASLKKSERSTQANAAKVTVTTLLASLLAGIFSGVVADKQPNQVQVAETPSEPEPARAKQVSLSRSENTQLLTLDDIKNISSEDALRALNGREILLGELTDYEFAKTLKAKPGWTNFDGKLGIIQGVIGDDVDFSDPKNAYTAVISGAANLESLKKYILEETKPISPHTKLKFTIKPSDKQRPVRIPSIPDADCYPILTKQVNDDGAISFNFHISEIKKRVDYTRQKQKTVLEPVFNPYPSQEKFI